MITSDIFSASELPPLDKLPNELSAPYEVPHFPIEKIETKKLK